MHTITHRCFVSLMSHLEYVLGLISVSLLTDNCEFDTQVLISAPVRSGQRAETTRCILCGGRPLKM